MAHMSANKQSVAAIIPTFNEVESIGAVVAALFRSCAAPRSHKICSSGRLVKELKL
jgi:hypothetical protein